MKHGIVVFLWLGVAATAVAQSMSGHGMAGGAAGSETMTSTGSSAAGPVERHGAMAQGAAELADGEVRKVNKDAMKLTIRHGAIAHMDMPPMTMVYRVSDPVMLNRVKAGDKIRFSAEKIGGAYVVTRIEAAQ